MLTSGPENTAAGLARLEAALARDFKLLSHPPAEWVPERIGPDGRPVADVLIVGAGMNGLAAAFALRRLGISRIRQLDRAPPGREGPWLTYARMELLRSPKHLTGPALGIPNLTFRAWWEAQRGDWEALGYIPREVWAAYLAWYGRVTGARIESGRALAHLQTGSELVTAVMNGEHRPLYARQVVLATGREGQARPRVPPALAPFLGRRVRHSSEPIDIAALGGRRVAVIGLAASAFDNAAAAAEAGAEVTLIGRAESVPVLNKMKQTVYPGFAHGFSSLPDSERLEWLRHIGATRIAPPRHTVRRVAASRRVRLLLGAEVTGAAEIAGGLRIATTRGTLAVDDVILGTGFAFDIGAAPELSAIAPFVLRYRDILGDEDDDELLDCPALDEGFAFGARPGTETPGLGRIRCFTHSAQPSLGNLANDIPHSSEGAERLATAIARALFLEDRTEHRRRLWEYADPELLGDEWPEEVGPADPGGARSSQSMYEDN